jgi:hypothetical protein
MVSAKRFWNVRSLQVLFRASNWLLFAANRVKLKNQIVLGIKISDLEIDFLFLGTGRVGDQVHRQHEQEWHEHHRSNRAS